MASPYTDSYEILSVPRSVTRKDLKDVYKNLMLKYHPDKAGDASLDKCKQIISAYERISEDIDAREGKTRGHSCCGSSNFTSDPTNLHDIAAEIRRYSEQWKQWWEEQEKKFEKLDRELEEQKKSLETVGRDTEDLKRDIDDLERRLKEVEERLITEFRMFAEQGALNDILQNSADGANYRENIPSQD